MAHLVQDLLESDIKFLVFAHHHSLLDGLEKAVNTAKASAGIMLEELYINVQNKGPGPERWLHARKRVCLRLCGWAWLWESAEEAIKMAKASAQESTLEPCDLHRWPIETSAGMGAVLAQFKADKQGLTRRD
eukprot:scaffold84227_cov20-Tisochrysis_lutea.AAC.2